jgi:hypothetical protein
VVASSSSHRCERNRGRETPWPPAWRGASSSYRAGFFLCDLGDKRNPFCSLTAAETDGGELAVIGRLGQSSIVVGGASGGAPAPGTAPVAALAARTPLLSSSSAREGLTQWGVSASLGGYGG